MNSRHDAPGAVRLDGLVRTPVSRLDRLFPEVAVWAKLDQLQISGSAKERSAQYLLDGLAERGLLGPGTTVVASSSGNLGVALARQCALRGQALVVVVDALTNDLTLRSIAAFGARADVVEVPEGGNRLVARIERVEELTRTLPGAVAADQYGSDQNPRAHASTTLPELVEQLGAVPSHLYVATSTVGTLVGCQRAIDEHGWRTQVLAVDAVGSVLFGGEKGTRKLPGLGAGFESAHALVARPAAVRRVNEADMVRGCRLMARTEGLLVGASTGGVVAALLRDVPDLPAGSTVAMLVHDAGAPYLSTVFDDEWVSREVADGPALVAEFAPLAPKARTTLTQIVPQTEAADVRAPSSSAPLRSVPGGRR